MNEHYTITIARGFGSGGKLIASRLAKELGIHCYENRILTLAAQLSGLDEDLFRAVNEKLSEKSGGFSALLKGLPRSRNYIARKESFFGDDRLFDYQRQIIENLNEQESCVIVGKCADYILRDRPNVIRIYIDAPRDYCIERTMKNMQVPREVANETIEKTDRYRAEYYSYYTGGKSWTNPVNYDMVLNSEKVGIEGCVEMIRGLLVCKGFLKETS